MREAKKTLIRVIALIWMLAAVVIAVGGVIRTFVSFAFLPYLTGELAGSAVATALMVHLYSTLDVELDMNRKGAVNHSKLMASLRLLISLAVLWISFRFPQWFSPVTVFAGLFAAKVAALLYPVVFRSGNHVEPEEED